MATVSGTVPTPGLPGSDLVFPGLFGGRGESLSPVLYIGRVISAIIYSGR